MKAILGKHLFTLFFFMYTIVFSQNTNTDIRAEIKIETTDNSVRVVPSSSNTTEVYHNLRYVLSIIKNLPNTDKVDKTTQEELFTLVPTERKDLMDTSFQIDEGQRVIILLLIYNEDNKLVAKDRFVLNDKEEKEEEVAELPEDGIELLGIVTDDTKTKMGKDFYDYFFSQYNLYEIKGKKIVNVQEVVSFRRNTQIQVKIEDEIIFQFISQPNDEYLFEMSKTAVQRVYGHFEKLKKENAYITQY